MLEVGIFRISTRDQAGGAAKSSVASLKTSRKAASVT